MGHVYKFMMAHDSARERERWWEREGEREGEFAAHATSNSATK